MVRWIMEIESRAWDMDIIGFSAGSCVLCMHTSVVSARTNTSNHSVMARSMYDGGLIRNYDVDPEMEKEQ